ncbi:MAG: IclR family transcriptional regulator [Burkholderiaceae bacterium]
MPDHHALHEASPDSQSNDRQFATTLARGLNILRCFTPDEPTLANGELAALTGLSKATISRFTYTLTMLGYLKLEPRTRRYRLGSAVLSLGYPMLATIGARQAARPLMSDLADYAQGSVSLGIRDRLDIVYIETSRSRFVFSSRMADIGMSHPIIASAIGRAYLCACTPEEQRALLNEIRVKTPEQWARHAHAAQQSLASFAELRFCVSYGDLRRETHAVAVPLRRSSNAEIVVVNCVVQSFQMKPGQLVGDLGPRLAAMARTLEYGST